MITKNDAGQAETRLEHKKCARSGAFFDGLAHTIPLWNSTAEAFRTYSNK